MCVCVCSCSKCVPDQCQLFDRLPSLCVEEFLSYSCSLSAFYHLDRVYMPVTMETTQTHEHQATLIRSCDLHKCGPQSREKLQELHPPLIEHQQAGRSFTPVHVVFMSLVCFTWTGFCLCAEPSEETRHHAPSRHDWLTEVPF